jgi:hypothetical protein
MAKSTAVIKPNLGLYLDRPAIALQPGALQGGLNFRVQLGQLNNLNLGWSPYKGIQLNGPVKLIVQFNTSEGETFLLLGSFTDLYQLVGSTLTYLTPTYTTGTAQASGANVVGSGTAWATTITGAQWPNAKVGDQISFNSSAQNSPGATWYTIIAVNSDTSITLNAPATQYTTYVTEDGSANYVAEDGSTLYIPQSSSAYTIRRLFTGGFQNNWNYEFFVDADTNSGTGIPVIANGNDQIVLTNGVDNVVSWDGIAPTVILHTEFGFTCKSLVQFTDMMCYLNVIYEGTLLATTMMNSNAGAPFEVGNNSVGVANQFIVQADTDPILNGRRLGPYLAIYCNHNLILASNTGSATVFAFRLAASYKGVVGQNAIASYPTIHQFIAPDGMYYFDGSNVQPLNTHVWRALMSTFDSSRVNNIFTYLDESNGEQIWSIPQTTDPGSGTVSAPNAQAWSEHYLEETAGQTQSALIASAMGINRPYSTRSFPFSAIGPFLNESVITWNQLTNQWQTYNYAWNSAFFSLSFPITLVGDNNGYLYQLNAGQLANGTPLNAYVTFGRRATADGKMRAMVRRVYPFVSAFPSPLTVVCGFADYASGPVTTSATFPFDQSYSTIGQFMVPVYRRGRYLDLTFGDASGNPWIINGFDIDVLPGGQR